MKRIIQICLALLMFAVSQAYAQQTITLQSTVTDDKGQPIQGAQIYGNEGAVVVETDASGKFTIKVKPGSMLHVEMPGYESKLLSQKQAVGSTIVLIASANPMGKNDEVNIAFGEINTIDLIGDVTVIEPDIFVRYDNSQYVPDAITGRIPGMFGSNNIRGFGNALVVLDGIPRYSNITDVGLNMEEIDQITVLKDAASVVLYGAQARNGVIIITTKRGKAYKREINVYGHYGVAQPKALPTYLNSADYMEYYNQALLNDGLPAQFSEAMVANYRYGNPFKYPNVDYYSRDYLKSYVGSSKIITEFSGGNENTVFYANLGWGRSGTLLDFGKGENAANNTFNTRANVDFKINNFIRSSLDIAGIFDFDKGPRGDYWSSAATLRPYLYSPLIPISMLDKNNESINALLESRKNDVDGLYLLGGTQQNQTNPIADTYVGGYDQPVSRTMQFSNGIDVDLGSLVSGLSLKTNISFDFYNSYVQSVMNGYSVYEPTWSGDSIVSLTQYGLDDRTGTQVVNNADFLRRIGFFGQLNYDRTFSEVHNVSSSLLGFANSVKVKGTLQPDKNANVGIRINYNYNHKYYLDFSGAYINSTKLPEGNKGGFSPAVSLGWVLSNERFLSNKKSINFLKLYASASVLKNDMTLGGFYYYENLYSNQGRFQWSDGSWSNAGVTSQFGANPNLGYENRKEISVGMTGRFFNNILGVDLDYFQTNITDQYSRPSNLYPGYYSDFIPYTNFGEDAYSGIELGLDFLEMFGDFTFDLGISGMYWNSEVIQKDELYAENYLYRTGKDVDAIFGLESEGLFRDAADIEDHAFQGFGVVKPGDIKYKDQNGDNVIDNNDQIQIGRSQSPLSLGLTIRLSYKSLTMFAIGEGRFGADNYTSGDYYWLDGDLKYSDQILNSWTEETKSTATYPRLSSKANLNNHRVSDFWMYNDNYFDLRRVQLTYDMPANLSKKLAMRKLSVFINGSGLETFSKHKDVRELNVGSTPQYRYYRIGLRSMF